MDRRRYVPSTEGLEGRALLATGLFGGTTSKSIDPAQEVPVTYALKEHRVERLPHFLELIKSGRYLPADTVKQLQADLLDVAANLHAPGSEHLVRVQYQAATGGSSSCPALQRRRRCRGIEPIVRSGRDVHGGHDATGKQPSSMT